MSGRIRKGALVAGAALSLLLSACAGNAEGGGDGARKMQVSVGVDPSYALDFVAKREGLFKKHDLDVNLVQYSPAGNGVDAMIAGTIDAGAAGDANSLIKSTRGGIATLAIYETSGKYMKLVVAKGIDDPSQIKKMGVSSGSLVEYGAIKVLEYAGVDVGKVKLVNAGVSEFPALLAQGGIDAFLAYEPFVSQAKEQGAKVLGVSGDWGFSYSFLVDVNEKWLADHEDMARDYIAALSDAADVIEKDPEAAAQAISAETKMPVDAVRAAMGDVTFVVRDFTDDDLARFKDISAYLVDSKAVEKAPDLDAFVRRGFASAG